MLFADYHTHTCFSHGTVSYTHLGTITPPVPEPGYIIYVVQPGDTLYDLARRFGTTVDCLLYTSQQRGHPRKS